LAGLIASLARAETGVAAIGALASEVNLLTGRRAFVLRLRGQTPEPAVAVPAGSVLEDEYLPQAARAFTYGSAQPPATYGRSGRPIAFYPFGETGESRHVLAADFPDGTGTGVDELDRTIGLMGAQTEEALARIARIDEVNAARLQVQTETLRSGLLLSLSHDLRTPLSGILGAVSSLREPSLDLTPDVRRDLLQAAEEETRRLARYVDDLLTLTRLQTGMKPALMPADAGDIVSVAVSRARAAHSTCTILIAQSGTAYPLLTDDALLGQALFNLLDNAVKHGGANQPVTVTLFYDKDAFAVQVADKGAGIPEEARSRIFDPLFRGGDSHGAGLGLAIVRSAVTVLGGSVELVQQPHGATGTAFLIRLPKSGGGS